MDLEVEVGRKVTIVILSAARLDASQSRRAKSKDVTRRKCFNYVRLKKASGTSCPSGRRALSVTMVLRFIGSHAFQRGRIEILISFIFIT